MTQLRPQSLPLGAQGPQDESVLWNPGEHSQLLISLMHFADHPPFPVVQG